MPPTPAEVAETRRGAIESEYNGTRDSIEKQYIEDRNALEEAYRQSLNDNDEAKRQAFREAGLNSDGSDPQGRPEG